MIAFNLLFLYDKADKFPHSYIHIPLQAPEKS